MKCIAATVMVALVAAIAEGSYVPAAVYGGHHGYAVAPVVAYAAHHGAPTVVQSNDHNSWAYANAYNNHWGYAPTAVAYNSWDGHYAPAAVAYQGAHWNHWDGHHVAAPVQHAASYVAANRGAVHKAPLIGHAVNQKSLNLAPAPGTW